MLCQIADDITPKCDNHTIVICMELHIRSLVFSCYPYYYVVVRGQVKMLNEPTCPFYLLLSFIAPYKAGGTVTRYFMQYLIEFLNTNAVFCLFWQCVDFQMFKNM
jgi:hypothetical protein